MLHRHVLGGSLLVAGTSIGAGMLGLPVQTGQGGFFPSLVTYLLCWLFMTATGVLLVEICLKMSPDVNLVSMATHYFGRTGKIFAWVLYLFLFYCLSIAYVSVGGQYLGEWFGLSSLWACGSLFVLFFAPFVYFGTKFVDRLNLFLMAGLIGSYFLFIFFGLPHIHLDYLTGVNWKPAVLALPIIFVSFSYQGMIPSLTAYMRRDASHIRLAIILGTTLTFVVYLCWQFLILAIIPTEGLEKALQLKQTAVQPLASYVTGPVILVGHIFAFLAIATSYLGVTLGLLDFLADGFRMAKKGGQRLFLAALTFLPPLTIALTKSGVFLTALNYAGGIGCALLLGLLPILMVWKARRLGETGPRLVPGGRLVLFLLALFVLFEVAMELFNELGS
jgi:tyrosine-specific transport protein